MKILLAEDNDLTAMVLKLMLEEAGHEVIVAHNGKEVLDYLYQQQFSVLLVDRQMPELNGADTIKAIRSNTLFTDKVNIPIIAMTCSTVDRDITEMVNAGANTYIDKLANYQLLLATIEHAVNQSIYRTKEA